MGTVIVILVDTPEKIEGNDFQDVGNLGRLFYSFHTPHSI